MAEVDAAAFSSFKLFLRRWGEGGALHRGSVRASHPAAILGRGFDHRPWHERFQIKLDYS